MSLSFLLLFGNFLIGYLLGWGLEHRRVVKIWEEMKVTIAEMQETIQSVRRENELAWAAVNRLTDRLTDLTQIK